MNNSVQRKYARMIGRPLRQVAASMHMYERQIEESPLSLWLYFDGLDPFRFFGTPDGWRIGIDQTQAAPVDMGESGEVVIRDISRRSVLSAGLDKILKVAWEVRARDSGQMIGVRFDFGLSFKPMILNWDDELHIADEYPSEMEESITEVPILKTTE